MISKKKDDAEEKERIFASCFEQFIDEIVEE